MPIYEFYCADCHTLFNFFSSVIDTTARPSCPRCRRPDLERRPARFATLKHKGDAEPDPFGDLDESRLAGVMESMMGELGAMEESEDPRQMARLFRRFGEASGLDFGPRMEEMMGRLEAGEDPDKLEDEICSRIPSTRVNGNRAQRLPNTTNISFEYVEGEGILLMMDEVGICASSGSACTSGSLQPSHVLRAMGVPFTAAHGSIRFSLSVYNTEEEVDLIIEKLPPIIERLRKMSPFWSQTAGACKISG